MIFKRDSLLLLLITTVYLSILMNATLITVGIKYFYLIPTFTLIIYLFSDRFNTKNIQLLIPYFIYLLMMLTALSITIIFLDGDVNSFISFGLYAFPFVVWCLFYSNVNGISYSEIFVSSIFYSSLVGYIGVFQFLVEPTLFGLIPLKSNAFIWAADKSFDEYSSFFRATSVLGSPQVFGLFCAINLILTLRYKTYVSKMLFYFGVVGLGIGGALSGNKTFFLIVILYVSIIYYKLLFTHYKFFLSFVGFIFIFLIAYQDIVEKLPMIERVFSVSAILKQEQSVGRLDRYIYIVKNANLFFGEGLGVITNQSTDGLQAAESYFLKIYYEAGAFMMLMFLYICFLSYRKAKYHDTRDSLIIALTVLGMVVVHAFDSPAFFLVWGHLLGGIFLTNSRLQHRKWNINAR
ncbi:MAG: hypothetical protein ACI978_000508 [Oleispira sp.]|jgi:hypothetical protein